MPIEKLPLLEESDKRTAVQRTTLSIDVLGRFICNTLDEAINPERSTTPPFDLTSEFDVIVIGSGMYGAYCASRLWRNGAKVLVLEAGPFLISEHYQNLSRIGLGTGGTVPGDLTQESDANKVKDQVFGLPWRGNQRFGLQAFCVGGKSLFWGGWSPRLTDDVLAGGLVNGAPWPQTTADYLKKVYPRIELQMGVAENVFGTPGKAPTQDIRTDLFNAPGRNLLTAVLRPKLEKLVGQISVVVPKQETVPNSPLEVKSQITAIKEAPLAIQADAPASGLFSFDKFSSLPVLVESVREDNDLSQGSDQHRRLFIVPNTRALRLELNGAENQVTGIEVWDGTKRRTIPVAPQTRVVMALNGIESTRIALESFSGISPLNSLMGRNLMAHLRNNFSVRIRRTALGIGQSDVLQTAAFHVEGKASTGARYHYQFYAGFQPGNSAEAVLYRMVESEEIVDQLLANQDPEWVSITFRGCGEMWGRVDLETGNNQASYINMSGIRDEFGQRRAWVHLEQQPEDLILFDEMDQAMFILANALAGNKSADIEYFDPKLGQFVANNPFLPVSEPNPKKRYGKLAKYDDNTPIEDVGVRDSIGSTYHDCGTLWMGDDPANSITDPTGRFHKINNTFCVDQAVFPRGGSANPVPTGLAIARLAAETITSEGMEVVESIDANGWVRHAYRTEPGFDPLFVFRREALLPDGWRHLGAGAFIRFGLTLETTNGIGLLLYEKKQLTDFTLRLQWRAPTVSNNSGIYVRLPQSELNDVDNLIRTGYEIQIDNTGDRPGFEPGKANDERYDFPQQFNNTFHQTGAIYPVHAKRKEKDAPDFPLPQNLPNPNGGEARREITSRPLNQWNDMEVQVGGNRIRVLLNGVSMLVNDSYVDSNSTYPTGFLAIQNHFKGKRVQFRHVRVKGGTPTL